MHISQYKHCLGFILGLFVVLFCFLSSRRTFRLFRVKTFYFILFYFIQKSAQHICTTWWDRETQELLCEVRTWIGPTLDPVSDHGWCSEHSREEIAPVPWGLSWCPWCSPTTPWSLGFLSWSWTAVFDSHQQPGPLWICLIWSHSALLAFVESCGEGTGTRQLHCEISTCSPSF